MMSRSLESTQSISRRVCRSAILNSMNSPGSARRSVIISGDETTNKSSSSPSSTSTNTNGTAAVSASHQMIMTTAVFVVWKVDSKQPIN